MARAFVAHPENLFHEFSSTLLVRIAAASQREFPISQTVPVEQIWLDTAEQARDHAAPYAAVELSIIKVDMRRVVEFFVKTGSNRKTAIERLCSIEPISRSFPG